MGQVCSVIVFNSNISWSLCLIMFVYSFAAAFDFSNKLGVGFLMFPVPDGLRCPWNDQLMFSLIKTASSLPKAGKLRKWAPIWSINCLFTP